MEQEGVSQRTGYEEPPADLQLFRALRRGDRATVAAVLDRHPDLANAQENWPKEQAHAAGVAFSNHATALIRAAECADLASVELLVERGADVNRTCGCDGGESALWVAVAAKSPEVARLLAEAGADVDHRAFVGHTPLHVAAIRGWDDLVALLLEFGADPEIRDDAGRTALDWARENGHHSVVRLLDAAASAVQAVDRPVEPGRSSHGALFVTGIKTIDLLAPICHGDLIRWDPAVKCTHLVFLTELTQNFLQSGYRGAIWAGFEDEYINLRQLRHALGELGDPELVTQLMASGTLSAEQRREHLERVRAELDARIAEAPGSYLVVIFQDRQQMSDPNLAFPALNRRGEHAVTAICTTPGQFPARPAQPLELRPPIDARVAHDPLLMAREMAPAMDAVVMASSHLVPDVVGAEHVETSARARALLAHYNQLDPELTFPDPLTFSPGDRQTAVRGQRLHAFLTQPFRVAEVFSGMRGDRVPLEETVRGACRILDGDLDNIPVQQLFYSGRRTQKDAEAARWA